MAKAKSFYDIYSRLRSHFGFLNWWPGETKDEIIIGAILTQNTNWKNVEKALFNLRQENLLDIKKLSRVDRKKLEKLTRPSGFYRQKAERLSGFAKYVYKNYDSLDDMLDKDKYELRNELLSLNGIGMETADSISLYAADKTIFVIDAYTRRIVSRLNGCNKEYAYEELQRLISENIKEDLELYKDFHAQFVQLGKNFCRKKPLCIGCPLSSICPYPRQHDTM